MFAGNDWYEVLNEWIRGVGTKDTMWYGSGNHLLDMWNWGDGISDKALQHIIPPGNGS